MKHIKTKLNKNMEKPKPRTSTCLPCMCSSKHLTFYKVEPLCLYKNVTSLFITHYKKIEYNSPS